jgi:hypothetical protein
MMSTFIIYVSTYMCIGCENLPVFIFSCMNCNGRKLGKSPKKAFRKNGQQIEKYRHSLISLLSQFFKLRIMSGVTDYVILSATDDDPHTQPSVIVMLSRFIGLMLVLPSFLLNVQTLNCVLLGFKSSRLQNWLIFFVLMSIFADISMGAALLGWLMNGK